MFNNQNHSIWRENSRGAWKAQRAVQGVGACALRSLLLQLRFLLIDLLDLALGIAHRPLDFDEFLSRPLRTLQLLRNRLVVLEQWELNEHVLLELGVLDVELLPYLDDAQRVAILLKEPARLELVQLAALRAVLNVELADQVVVVPDLLRLLLARLPRKSVQKEDRLGLLHLRRDLLERCNQLHFPGPPRIEALAFQK